MGEDKEQGGEGARSARGAGVCRSARDDICQARAVQVEGKAGFEHAQTLEADIVSDADNIDRFGAYRILQWCVPEMGDFPALADNLRQRVVRLEGYRLSNPLETPSGRALFDRQLERQITFFKDLIVEYELTRMPGIGY